MQYRLLEDPSSDSPCRSHTSNSMSKESNRSYHLSLEKTKAIRIDKDFSFQEGGYPDPTSMSHGDHVLSVSNVRNSLDLSVKCQIWATSNSSMAMPIKQADYCTTMQTSRIWARVQNYSTESKLQWQLLKDWPKPAFMMRDLQTEDKTIVISLFPILGPKLKLELCSLIECLGTVVMMPPIILQPAFSASLLGPPYSDDEQIVNSAFKLSSNIKIYLIYWIEIEWEEFGAKNVEK